MDGCDTRAGVTVRTSLAAGCCAAALGSRSGQMRRRGTGLGSLTGLLLCYPGGGAITLATGVNLNLETNHQQLGDGDVIGVQMG